MSWLNRLSGSESPKLERPVRAAVGYVLQRTGRFEHVQIRRPGYRLPFFSASNVALTYWVSPDLIDPTEEFVRSILRPGDVFVDVGANVGTVSAAAAGVVGPTGRVLAIEPHPTTFDLLRRTIEANGLTNVDCVEVACGSAAGTARLTDQPRKDDNNKIAEAGTGVPVRTVTLADVLDEHAIERADLVKIDVEGFEGAVLRGLAGAFERVDAFHVEVIDANLQRYGDRTSSIISLLQAHGFTCFELTDDPTNLVALANADRAADLPAPLRALPVEPTAG